MGAKLSSSSSSSSVELELRSLTYKEDVGHRNINNNKHNNDNDLDGHQRNQRCEIEKSEHKEGGLRGSTSDQPHQGFIEEEKEEVSSKKKKCTHPACYGLNCVNCGQNWAIEYGLTSKHIEKDLRLNETGMVGLHSSDMKTLLSQKKLYLVLDLDHTLLNTTMLNCLEYLKAKFGYVHGVSRGGLFVWNSKRMMTKLRPFVHTFLREASEMFEMYIYSLGDRFYVQQIAKLLDPGQEYFNGRLISRDDTTNKNQKNLDMLLGKESAVVILDDREDVWREHKDNLIPMPKYHYFASSCRQFGYKGKSLSELKEDEMVPDGALASVLKVLKQIHYIVFNELDSDSGSQDVRKIMKTVRKEVLKGCKIVFSIHQKAKADSSRLWRMAKQLGATCSTKIDPSVTHVVSADPGTETSCWAVKEKKFLVNGGWIEATYYSWQKQDEKFYPVVSQKV